MELQPVSYNDFIEQYGGTFEEFNRRSLAYFLQQNQTLSTKERTKYEALLTGYDKETGRAL